MTELERLGHTASVLAPDRFLSLPCPGEPSIRLAVPRPGEIPTRLDEHEPDAIHLATEGPLGWATRSYCLRVGIPFTTSYCTRWPEYLHARCRFPREVAYDVMRGYHGAAVRTTVASPGLLAELEERGFERLVPWSRGVDLERFRPRPKTDRWPRPLHLYVGRVAPEKNLEAFLRLELEGTKLVVGDGPALADLRSRYPDAVFAGTKVGEELAELYADADVFVFPSLTDTFGLVVLEALASGVPVAAFPVRGPLDILGDTNAGALDDHLDVAISRALELDPATCRETAARWSWTESARQLVDALAPR